MEFKKESTSFARILEKATNNRAASQSVINTMNAEKEVIVEESTKTKKEKPSRKERKSKK